MKKTTSVVVGSEFPAEERVRSVSKKKQCFSLLALPSGYAADEVEKLMLVSSSLGPRLEAVTESRPASRCVGELVPLVPASL